MSVGNSGMNYNFKSGGCGAFIAWRKLSRRSILLSRYLDMDVIFIRDSPPYLRALLKTIDIVKNRRNRWIIAQLPQGPLLGQLTILKRIYNFKLIADVHTGFLVYDNVKGYILNRPFLHFLNYCEKIILHNHTIYEELIPHKLKKRCLVVYDPWFLLEEFKRYCSTRYEGPEYIVFITSFASDEPVDEVLSVLSKMKNIKVYVTGDWKRNRKIVAKHRTSNNIVFTGYIPDDEYYRLLCHAKAVIAGTKREYTSLLSAWEALTFNKPLALSYTRTLYKMFAGYAHFYHLEDHESIEKAIIEIMNSKYFAGEIYTKLKNETLAQLNELKNVLQCE